MEVQCYKVEAKRVLTEFNLETRFFGLRRYRYLSAGQVLYIVASCFFKGLEFAFCDA